MKTLRILNGLLFLVAVFSIANDAHAAEPSPAEAAIEEQLNQGIALRRTGNDEAALALFLDMEKRSPESVRLLLHIATAAQATGKWLVAYDYLQRAQRHKDDSYYQRHKMAIDNVEKTIDQRVGQFRATGGPAGAEVRLSGEVVGAMPMTTARAVEVGSYWLEVSMPGYFPLRRPVTVSGGTVTQEDVELRAQTPFSGGTLSVQADGPAGPARDTRPAAPATGWRARWVTFSLLGVGVAAAATSGVAFAIREADATHWNDPARCLNPSSPNMTRQQICSSVRRDIDTAQAVDIAAGVAAGVFGAAALIHWLSTSPSVHPVDRDTRKAVTARCAPGFASFVCSGSF